MYRANVILIRVPIDEQIGNITNHVHQSGKYMIFGAQRAKEGIFDTLGIPWR